MRLENISSLYESSARERISLILDAASAMIVLPAARSGLMTAIILGIARIAGETAPLLLLTGGGDKVNPNPFSGSVGSLPYYIWKSFNAGSPEAITRAWAGLLILMILVLILFVAARALSNRKMSK